MKHIKILEQFIAEAKKFKAGDKWSKDFDYEGMLAAGLKVDVNTPVKKLNKLYDSFTDVNYHTIAKGLGIAIDWIEDNDKKGAEDYMDQFHKAVQDELKVNEGINLKASHLSSEDYQKAKKLKAFDSTDWVWNPKSNLYDKVSESVDEASMAKVHKAAKKGSYPVTLVVIEKGKVVKQELVGTPQIVPAAFNTLQKEYPNATIHIESKTGERLFSESVNEGLPPGYAKFLVSLQTLIGDIAPNAWEDKSQIDSTSMKRIHNSLKKRYGDDYAKFNDLLKTQKGQFGNWYLNESVNEADSDWPLENKKWEKLWNDSQTAPNTNTERKHMRWIVTNAKKYGLDPDRVDKLIGDWDGWAWKRHNGGFEDWMDGKLSESVNEGSNRDPESIRKEYEELKKHSMMALVSAWSRINKVGNPKSLDREGLISDLLRAKHGNKYVDKAFESVNEGYSYFDGEMARDLKDKGIKFSKGDKVTLEIQPNNYVIYGPNKKQIVLNKRDFKGAIDQYVIYESVNKSNIPNFENFNINEAKIIKDYMSAISIKDFKNIKKGDEVKYMGGTYTITRNNGYTITLQGSEKHDKAFDVNYSMFNHGGMIIEGKSYQEKFKEESDYYQEMINDPSKRVYDMVDFAQFTTGGMTQKQWEMFMYGRYKKDLQSKDSKIKEKMYKVLNKWLGESVTESSSKDGGDKSNGKSHHDDHTNKSIAQHWKDTYGEEFHSKYPAIAKIVKSRPGIDRRELKRIWDETYGENFEEQYPALWQKLD